jgi:hypothetical protein
MNAAPAHILFEFHGPVTDDEMLSIIEQWQKRAQSAALSASVIRKLIRIMVESLQNAAKYGLREEGKVPEVSLTCESYGDLWVLTVSNKLETPDKMRIEKDLKALSGFDANQIAQSYRMMLEKGEQNAKGGIGLGLIDIYRKSGHLPEAVFNPTDQPQVWNYSLIIKMNIAI